MVDCTVEELWEKCIVVELWKKCTMEELWENCTVEERWEKCPWIRLGGAMGEVYSCGIGKLVYLSG